MQTYYTNDIDSVGDKSHVTFFEMMGSWSLGDYFKKERCQWSFELLTQVFGFDADHLAATVFAGDENAPRDEEGYIQKFCEDKGCEFALAKVWEKGGEGGIELAEKVLKTLETKKSNFHCLYETDQPVKAKIETIAKEIYGAGSVNYSAAANKQIAQLEQLGFGNLPICMAKTQYSLSDDPTLLGRPEGFEMNVREAYVSAGAGFIVVLTGSVMTMPGLSKSPAAYNIDVNDDGVITGLF